MIRLGWAILVLTVTCAHLGSAAAQAASEPGRPTIAQAETLRRAHQLSQAEALLTDLIARHPEDADALTALAEVRTDQNRPDDAAALLTSALQASPNSVPANRAFGDLLLAERHYPEAMDRFETVLAIAPADPAARKGEREAAVALALAARGQGHEDASLACLEHAAAHLADDPVLLTDLGIEAERVGQLARASEVLTQALKLAPNDPTALYAMARVELDRQQMPSAEAHLRGYLAQRPADASAHFGLGRLLAMELHTDEAAAEFRRSIELEPAQTESYYQLGQIELDQHHDQAAQEDFAQALARDPKHGGALTGMGILAYRAKDFAVAERSLALAVTSAPDYQPAHYYYGLTLARLGKVDASKQELARAAELASNLHAAPAQPSTAEQP